MALAAGPHHPVSGCWSDSPPNPSTAVLVGPKSNMAMFGESIHHTFLV